MSIPPNPSNMGQSVFTRLLNIARHAGETHQYLLTRYAIERLLYRLSISEYAEQFILKGGTLLLAWQGRTHRVTRDVDFLGMGTSQVDEIKQIFKTLCLIASPDDGVIFLPERLKGEEIMENKRYAGVRITLIAQIHSAKQTIQVDIGFGDVITPRRERLAYPSQLDMPAPQLWVYPKYTVIAEKFETMISLGIINSRLKDFYDVWLMMQMFDFEGGILKQAIESTFMRRNRPVPTGIPVAFTPGFYADKERAIRWDYFIKRDIVNRVGEVAVFADVIQSIQTFIMPVIESSKQGQPFNATWSKSDLAWSKIG